MYLRAAARLPGPARRDQLGSPDAAGAFWAVGLQGGKLLDLGDEVRNMLSKLFKEDGGTKEDGAVMSYS